MYLFFAQLTRILGDLLVFACADIPDAGGIDAEGDLDLWDPLGSRWKACKLKFAQEVVSDKLSDNSDCNNFRHLTISAPLHC